jgi:hypothetical protein
MSIKVYSAIQINEWACPGMLVAVNEQNEVVWIQLNPRNDLTRHYFDEDRDKINVTHFKSLTLVDEYEE